MKYLWTVVALFFFFLGNAQSLKLMTYNIRLDIESDGENKWSNRNEFLTSQIQFYEPDIFGIQEAKPNQVIDIASALSHYNFIGIGRDGVNQGESSNIYYKKDRFKLLQNSTFWLSETPDTISKGWDAAFNRVCTYALFKDLKTKTDFWVFNTHLDHMGELAKTNGIQLILSKIASLNTKKYPVIFMGDFNATPEEYTIKEFLEKEMGFVRLKPSNPISTHQVAGMVDHIFFFPASRLVAYDCWIEASDLAHQVSDHLPVVAEITIK